MTSALHRTEASRLCRHRWCRAPDETVEWSWPHPSQRRWGFAGSATCQPPAPRHAGAVKVDADTGDILAGADFQLWADDGDGELEPGTDTPLGDPRTTGAGGQATWGGLDFGDYIVEEVGAPDGYYLPQPHPTQSVSITVDNAGTLQSFTFEDVEIGDLLVQKRQLTSDGGPLQEVEDQGQVGYGFPLLYRMKVMVCPGFHVVEIRWILMPR